MSIIKAILEKLGLDGVSGSIITAALGLLLYLFHKLPRVQLLSRRISKWFRPFMDRIKQSWIGSKVFEDERIKDVDKHKEVVERYFKAEMDHFQGFCEFGFDVQKDYVENSKKIIESQATREYLVRPRKILGNKPLKHRDVINLLEIAPAGEHAQRKPFAIVGAAASGKTVEMMKIFAVLARDWVAGRRVPILIFVNSLGEEILRDLYAWTAHSPMVDLKKIVCSYLRARREPASPEPFITLLQSHWDVLNPILLFDATDECPVRQQADNMLDALAAAGRAPSPATIVVSCREKEYAGGDQFVQIRILELTPEQMVEHFLRQQAKWPDSMPQTVTKEEIEREMSASHPMANYLSNVYFLKLYLNARAARPSPSSPAPSSLSELFRKMFVRQINKAPEERRVNEHILPYLEDVLSCVADSMTESVLRSGSQESGVVIASDEFLGALLEILRTEVEPEWSKTVRAHLSKPTEETSSQLTGLLSSGTDKPFAAFTSRSVNHHHWTAGSTTKLACATLLWARKFGFQLPPDRTERKALRNGLINVIDKAPPKEKACVAGILALSFRALAWAIDGHILIYDRQKGRLVRFWHQRIREYLTARHIERQGAVSFLKGTYMDSAWWRETINMLVAITTSPGDILKAILIPPDSSPTLRGDAECDPWRVLVASESILFLPMEHPPACREVIGQIRDRLKELALDPIKVGKPSEYLTFKIWAIEALDMMLAKVVMPGDGTLVRKLVVGLREPALEKAALNALVTLLRMAQLGFLDRMRGFGGVLYGVLGRDPEPLARGVMPASSLGARVLLKMCCRSGWVMRVGAWVLCIGCVIGLVMAPFVIKAALLTWWFVPTVAALLLLLVDRAYASRSMADTIFRRLVRPPATCVGACCRGCVAVAKALSLALGRAIRKSPQWTARGILGIGMRLLWLLMAMKNAAGSLIHWLCTPRPSLPPRTRRPAPTPTPAPSSIRQPIPTLASPSLPRKQEQIEPSLWSWITKELRNAVASVAHWSRRSWRQALRALIAVLLAGALLSWVRIQVPIWYASWEYRNMILEVGTVKKEALDLGNSQLAAEVTKLDHDARTLINVGPPPEEIENLIGEINKIASDSKIESLDAGIIVWFNKFEKFERVSEGRFVPIKTYLSRNEATSSSHTDRISALGHGLADAGEEVKRLGSVVRTAKQTSARLKAAINELKELRRVIRVRDQIETDIRQPAAHTKQLLTRLSDLRSEIERLPAMDPPLKTYHSLRESVTKLEQSVPPAPPPPVPIAVNSLPEEYVKIRADIRKTQLQAEEIRYKLDSMLDPRPLVPDVDEHKAWESLVGGSELLERMDALSGQMANHVMRFGTFREPQPTEPIPPEEIKAVEKELETAHRAVQRLETDRFKLEKHLGEDAAASVRYLDRRMVEAVETVKRLKELGLRHEKNRKSASEAVGQSVLLQEKIVQGSADELEWWRTNEKRLQDEFKELQASLESLRKDTEIMKGWDEKSQLLKPLDNLKKFEQDLAAIAKLPESVRAQHLSETVLDPKRKSISSLVASPSASERQASADLERLETSLSDLDSRLKTIGIELQKAWWRLRGDAFMKAVAILLSVVLLGVLVLFAWRRVRVDRVLRGLSRTPDMQQRDTAITMLKGEGMEFVRQAIVQFLEGLRLKTPEDETEIHDVRKKLADRGSLRYKQTIGSLARIAADIRKRILHSE